MQEIGAVGRVGDELHCQPILGCEDTYPDVAELTERYRAFRESLERWLEGRERRDDLEAVTPAKHWLVRLLLHKLTLYERHCSFGKLAGVVAAPASKPIGAEAPPGEPRSA